MERDLRLIRRKRIERDRANGIGLDAKPPTEAETVPAETKVLEKTRPLDDADSSPEALQPITDPAVKPATAENAAPTADPAASGLSHTDEQAPEGANQEAISTDQGMPQDSVDSIGLAITMTPEIDAHSHERSKDPGNKLTDAAAAEAPLDMSEAVDIDFDSMFNDNDIGAEDALDFDFSLSTDAAMTQDIINDSNFENSNMTNANNADLTNVPHNDNEDIEGVLPGLESYLNTDTDFSNLSTSAAAALAQTSQAPAIPTEHIAAATGAPAQEPGDTATAPTSFDNFFGDFDMAGTDDLGDGTLGDLDDFDWS